MGNCLGGNFRQSHSPNAIKPSNSETSANNSRSHNFGSASSSSSSSRPHADNVNVPAKTGSGNPGKNEATPPSGKIITPDLKMFSLAELKSATRNFRPDTKLGEGGFGTVFKGWVDEKTYAPSRVGVGIAVAVKKSNPDSPQGLEEWQAEVKFLGKFSHPNLVKLLGYCWEERQYLLVYEYMQKGSLERHLFRKGGEPLPWDIRLKIAIGAAQGLAFLHASEKSVIYRDFKSSNILLDEAYHAKLSDFGLAKLGPANGNSHVTTRVMGTYGYAAPEYVATGHLYVKSDVYGFGVVLLEMLTGRRALDTNRPTNEQNLVEWAKPSLSEKRKLKKIMDAGLQERYPEKAAIQASGLILHCLESEPKNRPSMEEVLNSLQKISAIKEKYKEKVSAKNRASKSKVETSSHPRYNNHNRSPLRSRHGGPGDADRARAF